MVAYRPHFDEANLNLISLGQSGGLRDLRIVHSLFTQQVRNGDTRLDPRVGGGPLPDIEIYCMNGARYLYQAEPHEVFAMRLTSKDPRFGRVEEMDGALPRFPGTVWHRLCAVLERPTVPTLMSSERRGVCASNARMNIRPV